MGYEKERRPLLTPQDTESIVPGAGTGGVDGVDFSTTEQDTGQLWIDGSTPIYQKTFACGALPDTTTKNIAHGISGLVRVVAIRGWAKKTGINEHLPLPSGNDGASTAFVYVDGTNVNIVTGGPLYGYDEAYVTLWYLKS